MHYSGIVVTASTAETVDVSGRLLALRGVEIHLCDAERGRLVVVLESDDAAGFEAAFQNIRTVVGVVAAELAYHYVDPDAGEPETCLEPPPVLARQEMPAS